MKKAWMCECDLINPCFKNSKPKRCERTRDFTVTSGVFLSDAEYERMKNCDNCKHTYEACEEYDCPNGEKWQPKDAK